MAGALLVIVIGKWLAARRGEGAVQEVIELADGERE